MKHYKQKQTKFILKAKQHVMSKIEAKQTKYIIKYETNHWKPNQGNTNPIYHQKPKPGIENQNEANQSKFVMYKQC